MPRIPNPATLAAHNISQCVHICIASFHSLPRPKHELDRGFQAIKATVTAGNSWSLYVIFKLLELPTRKTPDLAGNPHHQTQRLAEARLVSQRCGLRVVVFFFSMVYMPMSDGSHPRSPSTKGVMVEKLTPHWLKPPTSRLSNQSSGGPRLRELVEITSSPSVHGP